MRQKLKETVENDGTHYLIHNVTQDEEGEEVLSLLYHVMGLTTKKIRSVKRDSRGILLDHKKVTVRETVDAGQRRAVLLDDSENRQVMLVPTAMPLEILYEDADLLFVNKGEKLYSLYRYQKT